MSATQQNPQAAFEQNVKLLGEWLTFLSGREKEYTLQMERAKKAAPSAASNAPVVEVEQEAGADWTSAASIVEETNENYDPSSSAATDVDTKFEAWI